MQNDLGLPTPLVFIDGNQNVHQDIVVQKQK